MEIPILVEPVGDNAFRVSSVVGVVNVEASTAQEAARKLRALIERSIEAGAQVLRMEIGGGTHPLWADAGRVCDELDALCDEFPIDSQGARLTRDQLHERR